MEVTYTPYINTQKNNRIEFLLINYDYADGNDYLARLFSEEYGFIVEKKLDGWWYSIIRIHLNSCIYELLWHEDIGNKIYCLNQTEEENHILQQRLERILCILNTQIKESKNSLWAGKVNHRSEDEMNRELQYPSRETICRLTKELGLEGANEYTQDWECEVANVNQLPKYINYYKTKQLNINEKTTLMRIILESYNDYIEMHYRKDEYGEMIKNLLESEYHIHQGTIKHWGCGNDNLEDCYAITPFIRTIRDRILEEPKSPFDL